MKPNLDDPQGYQARLKPIYSEMFRAAHAVIGNRDLAEFVLKNAVREAYLRRREWRDRMNFREGVLSAVRLVGLTELRLIRRKGGYELDWEGFSQRCPEGLGAAEQKLYRAIASQSLQTRRMMVLRHGCGFKERQIAEILNMKPAQVHEELTGCAAGMEHAAGKASIHGMERLLRRVMRAEMSRPGEDLGEMGAVLRSFERDVQHVSSRKFSVGHWIGTVFGVLGALVCAALIWLIAVLLEEPAARPPAAGDIQGMISLLRPFLRG